MITVAHTDDHPLVRKGMAGMLATSSTIRLIAQWNNAVETRKGLADMLPQVLLLDVNLPDSQGSELCIELKQRYPSLLIICISALDQTVLVQSMLDAGASGYLSKMADTSEIETAIRYVLNGKIYVSEKIENRLNAHNDLGRSQRLTRREIEILTLIAAELNTHQIAERLFISDKTVESHRANLLIKLGAKNVVGLVREALKLGLIS